MAWILFESSQESRGVEDRLKQDQNQQFDSNSNLFYIFFVFERNIKHKYLISGKQRNFFKQKNINNINNY